MQQVEQRGSGEASVSLDQSSDEQPTLSEGAIGAAIRLSPARVAELLRDDCRRGVVVRTSQGWRLSTKAERAFGHALRDLGEGPIVVGRRSRARHD